MPLSRLSPRRNRDALIRQRSGEKATANATASRHLRLWEAIRRTRDELSLWQARIDQVDGLFRRIILPREQRLTDACCELTEVLMARFDQAALSNADRSLLGLWITENLRSLQTHPFVSVSHYQRLLHLWSELLDNDAPIENQLARLARQHSIALDTHSEVENPEESTQSSETGQAAAVEDADDDIVFDFGWHKSSSRATESTDANTCNDTSNNTEQESTPHDERDSEEQHNEKSGRQSVDETVSVLEKRLSVDRLFRQLARVLHPDREQNEALKAQKHILMSQCLQARQEKDINTLLSLYCEHVGELPDDLTDDSHEELVKALQLQLQQLQQELRQKRFGDPLQTQIVERYGDSDTNVCEKRIAQHAKSLDLETQQLRRRIVDTQTTDGLESALTERRAIEQDRLSIDEITGMRS